MQRSEPVRGAFYPWQFGVDHDVLGRGSARDLFDEQLDVRDLRHDPHRTEWVIASVGMLRSHIISSQGFS